MNFYKKKCKKCGKEFLGTKTQQYCQVGCRKMRVKKREIKYDFEETKVEIPAPKPKKTAPKKKVPSVDEIAIKARELGMSYGKYIEMLTLEQLRKER